MLQYPGQLLVAINRFQLYVDVPFGTGDARAPITAHPHSKAMIPTEFIVLFVVPSDKLSLRREIQTLNGIFLVLCFYTFSDIVCEGVLLRIVECL